MPEMDGFETTRRLRDQERGGKRTPVVALTAGASPAERDRCAAADMDDFLAKPIAEAELLRVLGRWLGSAEAGTAGESGTIDQAEPDALEYKLLDSLRAAFAPVPNGFEDFIVMFCNALTSDLAALCQLVEAGELRPIALAAHRLAGVALQGGARQLGNLLVAVENAAHEGRRADVTTCTEAAKVEADRALDAVDQYLVRVDRAAAA
jgi:CheY-like chemotaxis protein